MPWRQSIFPLTDGQVPERQFSVPGGDNGFLIARKDNGQVFSVRNCLLRQSVFPVTVRQFIFHVAKRKTVRNLHQAGSEATDRSCANETLHISCHRKDN